MPSSSEEADLQRPDALGAGLQGVVDRVRGVMRVRDKQFEQPPLETGVVLVGVSVIFMVMVVTVVALMIMAAAVIVRVVVVIGVAVSGVVDGAHAMAWSVRWCAGIPPRACSA